MSLQIDNLSLLRRFIPPLEMRTMLSNSRGEEGQWFFETFAELAKLIKAMPKTGETDGKGDEAIAYLHYFAGSQASWYITERDVGDTEERAVAEFDGGMPPQHQAFGLADLFGDGGEIGYISIVEIMASNGELDLHWTPKTLAEIRHTNRIHPEDLGTGLELSDEEIINLLKEYGVTQ